VAAEARVTTRRVAVRGGLRRTRQVAAEPRSQQLAGWPPKALPARWPG